MELRLIKGSMGNAVSLSVFRHFCHMRCPKIKVKSFMAYKMGLFLVKYKPRTQDLPYTTDQDFVIFFRKENLILKQNYIDWFRSIGHSSDRKTPFEVFWLLYVHSK